MDMNHYVYKLTDSITGEYYYGSRTFDGNPSEDEYKGSMKTWKPDKSKLVKEIIKDDFDNREMAIKFERQIVIEHIDNPLNKNYSIPNTGFYYGGEPETNPRYGEKWSEQWKHEQSKRMTEYYKHNPATNQGKKFSEEWRKNISESRKRLGVAKGSKNPKSYGNVKITDLEGNEFVFDTAKEASIYFGVDRVTLTKHCKTQTTYQRGKLRNWKFEVVD